MTRVTATLIRIIGDGSAKSARTISIYIRTGAIVVSRRVQNALQVHSALNVSHIITDLVVRAIVRAVVVAFVINLLALVNQFA